MTDSRADLFIRRGNVITMDPDRPRAQSLALKFRRILAVVPPPGACHKEVLSI